MFRAITFSLQSTAAVTVFALATSTTFAQDAMGHRGILWKCMQENDEYFHIRCIPLPVPTAAMDASALRLGLAADLGPPETPRNGVPLWRGRDLRPVAMRGHDKVFSADVWRIPLFTRPADPLAVTRLLESVLCGEAPHCKVNYGTGGAWSASWKQPPQ